MLTDKQISHIPWTKAAADEAAPQVRRRSDGTYWVGDRRHYLRDDTKGMDSLLKDVYEDHAPNIRYLAFFSAVQQRALGIPRKHVQDWLFSQEGYQLFQPTCKVSSSRAILPHGPLKRLAIDAGTFGESHKSLWGGRTYSRFLVVTDLWTKYLWVIPMTADTAQNTIAAMKKVVAEVDPLKVATVQHDHGTPYEAKEFQSFCKDNGIRSLFTSVALPTSNGAELLQKARDDALKPEDKDHVQQRLSAVAKSIIYDSILQPGDKVRLSLAYWGNQKERDERDTSKLGKAHWQNYTKQVYTIDKKVGRDYTLKEKGGSKYDRAMLLKIVRAPAAVVEEREPTPPPPRPRRQPTPPPPPREKSQRAQTPRAGPQLPVLVMTITPRRSRHKMTRV